MYLLTIPTRSRLFGLNSLIIPSRNAIFLGSSPIAFCRRRILNTSQPDVILSRWPPGISSPQTCTRLSRFLWSSSPLRLFRSILKGLIETIIEFSATILSIFKRFMLCKPNFRFWLKSKFMPCFATPHARTKHHAIKGPPYLNLNINTLCDPPPPPPPPHEQNIMPYLNLLRILSRHVAKTLSLSSVIYNILPYKSRTPIPCKKGESP